LLTLIDKITSELDITNMEAEIFLYLLKNGRSKIQNIASSLNKSLVEIEPVCNDLVNKGMIIELSINIYQSLHPRFAAVNAYRLKCLKCGLSPVKNPNIDALGIALEKLAISEKSK
jgi:Sugar-specific transcriptional regulator TrmB